MGYRKRSSRPYKPHKPKTKLLAAPSRTKDQVKLLRQAIKGKCPTLSVRMARGTAYGWVDITGSKNEWGNFTDEETKALISLGLRPGGNAALISPEDRKYYLRKWGVIC